MSEQGNRHLTSPILAIDRTQRESLLNQTGRIVWFTGLSGSGKSTLANALEIDLHQQGKLTFLLDGDVVRQGLNQDLGFSDKDRTKNIRRIAHVAKLMMDAGLIVICAFISPFRVERRLARELAGSGRFIEVYLNTPISVCEERDVKGLYQKARSGNLSNLSGMGSNYETPENPELTIDTSKTSIDKSVSKILEALG
jgi:adenylyl-sulfate kinase